MNNRLSIPEIAGLIAEQAGVEKKKAERFLKEFVTVVRDAVFEDKIVKIKGIGTFKIVEVQDRESVDVNTGNRILIPGHSKFSFVPDRELREEVNKPFSFFETVEISDHIDSADMEHIEESKDIPVETEEVVTPEPEIVESDPEIPAADIPEIVGEEREEKEPEAPVEVTEEIIAEEKEEEPEIKEPESEPETPIEEPYEEEPVKVLEETIPVESVEAENNEEEDVEKRPGFFIPKAENQIIERLEEQQPASSGKTKVWWGAAACVVLLVASGIFFFQRYPLSAWNAERTDLNIVADSILDTIINEMMIEADSIENEEEDSDLLVQTGEPNTEIIATVNIKAGSRLTLIALEYYGNKVFWVYLYEHNKDLIKDPNNVPIGTEIAIPAPELYNINPNSKASIEKAALLQSQILSTF